MRARLAALFAASLLLLPFLHASADASCPPSNSHVWFLAVSDDSEEREDFRNDILTFERFLDELRDVYCIPAAQAKILAFDGSFTLGSSTYTYDEASEQNVKDALDDFGADASQYDDSVFFFFLSSHGLVYNAPLSGCGLTRPYGSFSALHTTGSGEDGTFYDCELGRKLTTEFDADVQMFVAVDCSFCGGFSDSLTAVSGTVPDGGKAYQATSSQVPGPNRIVVTGCAMTTECFGGGVNDGSVFYDNLEQVMDNGISACDAWTAPGFPTVQGFDVPVRNAALRPFDGTCTASEWFFAAVYESYVSPVQPIGIQMQPRIKFGATVTDLQVMA